MALFLYFQSVVLHHFTWRKRRAEEEKLVFSRLDEVDCRRHWWRCLCWQWEPKPDQPSIFLKRKAFLKGKPTAELLHCDKSN